MTHRIQVTAFFVVGLLFPAVVSAQKSSPREFRAAEATVERIMDSAIENISIRYELNDLQKEHTGEIMRRRVRAFLRDHEDEVWPILRELIATQFGLVPQENSEDTIRLGKAAGPLAQLAQEAILEGNAEWRKILNDDQKKLHDFDLSEMDETFRRMDDHFERWASGEPMGRHIFERRPASPTNLPPRPTKPPEGELPGLTTPVVDEDWPKLTFLDTIVEEFIQQYELDKGQVESARSILNEIKSKAADFKKTNKVELRAVANQLRNAGKKDEKDVAEKRRKQLLEPIYTLVAQMNGRLKLLLTKNQMEKYEQVHRTASAATTSPKRETAQKRPAESKPPVQDTQRAEKEEPAKPDAKPNPKSGEG